MALAWHSAAVRAVDVGVTGNETVGKGMDLYYNKSIPRLGLNIGLYIYIYKSEDLSCVKLERKTMQNAQNDSSSDYRNQPCMLTMSSTPQRRSSREDTYSCMSMTTSPGG